MRDGRSTRRGLLAAGSLLGLGSLAGCSQVRSLFDSPPKLGRIQVENRDDAPHTIHLLVERGGEIVYWQSFELDATAENEQGQTVRDIRTVSRSEWGDERGDYEVLARLDRETSVTADSVDHGAPCELLNVVVHGEPEVASLSIINAPADENCD
jgi:hypothetical protein